MKDVTGAVKDVTGAQIRMARAYLGWSAQELATNSDVGLSSIKRIEACEGVPTVKRPVMLSVVLTILETERVRFEGGTCVCVIEQGEGDE